MFPHVLNALRARPRESVGVSVLFAAALFAALELSAASSPLPPGAASTRATTAREVPAGQPPAPEPLQFKAVSADDARTINAVMPFSADANPKARPFAAKFADTMNEARALDCLTAAVYYEAAVEAPDGQRAVAQVVLNRLRHPAYPKTVCGVVFQGQERSTGCQFTFTCDGAMTRAPNEALWTRARAIAWAALSGQVFAPVGWATHYHTDWVVPYWASSLAKASKVGTHIFYRWTGGWGRSPAFTGRYAGVEPSVGKLASLSGAHGVAPVDVAVASDAALDALAANDEIVVQAGDVQAGGAERVTMRLNVAAGEAVGVVPVAKPVETKVPWELRWALTGSGPTEPEAALGISAVKTAAPAKTIAPSASLAKDCAGDAKERQVSIAGAKTPTGITVRETCGA